MQDLKKEVLAAVDEEGVVSLTSELVKIESITGNETPVALFLARECERLGFEVELLEVRGYNVPAPGRPNVVFRLKGTGEGPTLMYNGHLDTEPIPPGYDEIGEDPLSGRIDDDGFIYGVGTINMKASVAASVYAIKALRDAGVKLKGDVIFAGVIGEMEYGLGTRFLMEAGVVPDVMILGEPSDLRIAPMHVGITDFSIRLKGKPTHIGNPSLGIHAAPMLARTIDAIGGMNFTYDEKKYKEILPPRWNISYICGGYEYKTGLFMDGVALNMCIRMPPGATLESIMGDLNRVLDGLRATVPNYKATLLPHNPQWPTMPEFEVSLKEYVVQAVRKAHVEVRGDEPELMFKHGGTDAGWVQYMRGVTTAICGPGGLKGGTWTFTPPERVLISEVVDCTKIYALAGLDILTKTRDEVRPYYRLPRQAGEYDTSF